MPRVDIRAVDEETLRRYYNWPESKEYAVHHLINISLRTKSKDRVTRLTDMVGNKKYILTGTLVPRPGYEDHDLIDVEIETIGGYMLDLGESEECFSRGIWFQDTVTENLFYRVHEPGEGEYKTILQEEMRDFDNVFAFHDKLIHLYDDTLVGDYTELIPDEEVVYWRVKRGLTMEKLCRQEPDLDAHWICKKENAELFWKNAKCRIYFELTSSFGKSLLSLRNGKPFKIDWTESSPKSNKAGSKRKAISEADGNGENSDNESTSKEKTSPQKVTKKSTAGAATTEGVEPPPAVRQSVIRKRQLIDEDDDEIVHDAPPPAAPSASFSSAPPVKKVASFLFRQPPTQVQGKYHQLLLQRAADSKVQAAAVVTKPAVSEKSATAVPFVPRTSSRPPAKEEMSKEERALVLSLQEKEKNQNAELEKRFKFMTEARLDRWEQGNATDDEGQVQQKRAPRVVPDLKFVFKQWLYGCKTQCFCEDGNCKQLAGYKDINSEPRPAPLKLIWADQSGGNLVSHYIFKHEDPACPSEKK